MKHFEIWINRRNHRIFFRKQILCIREILISNRLLSCWRSWKRTFQIAQAQRSYEFFLQSTTFCKWSSYHYRIREQNSRILLFREKTAKSFAKAVLDAWKGITRWRMTVLVSSYIFSHILPWFLAPSHLFIFFLYLSSHTYRTFFVVKLQNNQESCSKVLLKEFASFLFFRKLGVS